MSTSLKGARLNLSLSAYGTVQSKMVLQEVPAEDAERLNSGDCEGSPEWHRTPGMKMVLTSP